MEPKIFETIVELLVEVTQIDELYDTCTGETDIINDIGLDSLQAINFLMMIEEELDIEIDYDEFNYEHIGKIKDFAAFVSELVPVLS